MTEVYFRSKPTPAEIHPASSVEDPDLRQMLDYWHRLAGTRRMPARSEISPKEIGRSLRLVHIYEPVEGGADFRVRLVGSSVFPFLDIDQTGKLVSENPDPGVRLRFSALLHHVLDTREPARSLSLRITGSPMTDARTEGLWLPLGVEDRVQHILAQSSLRPITPGFAGKPA